MKRFSALLLSPLLFAAIACEATKSSNPLTPTVAGPIPGVEISAPRPAQPSSGAQIPVDQQPVTLMVQNASTNGVRPLNYLFEVATDTNFTNKVFTRQGVAPGNGQTTLRLPDPLAAERAYYWRARAQDGANTGPYSSAVQFNVFTPIVIEPPTPVSPIGNAVIDVAALTFVVTNSRRSGPVGAISYMFELADSNAFTNQVGAWKASEQAGQTSINAGITLIAGKQYFWRAYAFDPTHNGPWSATQVFQTAAGSSPAPPPPGGGGNWQACAAYTADKPALSTCVHDAVNPAHTPEGGFEVTKRIAWLLRGEGVGLLIKNGGENIVPWQGYSFSASRVCYPDGHIYKVLTDVPTTNGPTWADNGFVDPSLYKAAIDPSLP